MAEGWSGRWLTIALVASSTRTGTRVTAMEMAPPDNEFSRRLRARMEELGLNQVEAADLLGVSQSRLSRWLNKGDFPSDENTHVVAGWLGISGPELAALRFEARHEPGMGTGSVERRLLAIERQLKALTNAVERLGAASQE